MRFSSQAGGQQGIPAITRIGTRAFTGQLEDLPSTANTWSDVFPTFETAAFTQLVIGYQVTADTEVPCTVRGTLMRLGSTGDYGTVWQFDNVTTTGATPTGATGWVYFPHPIGVHAQEDWGVRFEQSEAGTSSVVLQWEVLNAEKMEVIPLGGDER